MGKTYIFAADRCPVDYLVTFLDDSSFAYRGRIVAPPSGPGVLQLRDILAPYCHQGIDLPEDPQGGDPVQRTRARLNGRIAFTDASDTTTVENFSVYNDWSYGRVVFAVSSNKTILSDPIRKEIDARMPLLVSTVWTYYLDDTGLEPRLLCGDEIVEQYQFDRSGSLTIRSSPLGAGRIGKTAQMRFVTENFTNEFSPAMRVICTPYRWALYYVNAIGGWDHIILRGGVRETDEFERQYTAIHRNYLSFREVPHGRDYLVQQTRTWELNTGYLSDEESRLFSVHVLGTPLAYLYDMHASLFLPVRIMDTSSDAERTIVTNSRRPVSYTLTVQLAQERIRM